MESKLVIITFTSSFITAFDSFNSLVSIKFALTVILITEIDYCLIKFANYCCPIQLNYLIVNITLTCY